MVAVAANGFTADIADTHQLASFLESLQAVLEQGKAMQSHAAKLRGIPCVFVGESFPKHHEGVLPKAEAVNAGTQA